jgi:hypothetical protein
VGSQHVAAAELGPEEEALDAQRAGEEQPSGRALEEGMEPDVRPAIDAAAIRGGPPVGVAPTASADAGGAGVVPRADCLREVRQRVAVALEPLDDEALFGQEVHEIGALVAAVVAPT